MNLNNLPFNWFDLILVGMLFVGYLRGRKRGMSLELFTMLQWLVIVFACAFAYEPLGTILTNLTGFSLLTSYILCYLLVAGIISFLFVFIKRGLGEKVSGDTFGKSEYYLGIPAGMLRFLCMLIAGLAILNARNFTTKELKDREAYQKDVYGSEFFPGLGSLQRDVFERSLTGPFIKKGLSFLLIKPTFPQVTKAPSSGRPDVPLP